MSGRWRHEMNVVAAGPESRRSAKRQGILAQSSARLAGRLISMATAVVTLRYLTHYFGPASWGQASTALAYLAVVYAVVDFGLPALAARDLAAGGDQFAMADSVALRVVIGVLAIPVAGGGALLLYHGDRTVLGAVMVVLPTLLIGGLTDLALSSMTARARGTAIAGLDVFSGLVSLGAALLCASLHVSVAGYMALTMGATVTGALAAIGAARRRGGLAVSFDLGRLRTRLRQSAPLALVGALNVAYLRADMLILAAFRGPRDVGYYAVAYRIIEPIMFVPAVVMASALPAYMSAGPLGRQRTAQRCLTALAALALPMVVVGLIMSRTMIRIVAGPAFNGSVLPFDVLLIGAGISYVNGVYGNLLIAEGRQRLLVRLTASVLALNVVANLIVIPLWGPVAAAATTTGCEVVAGVWVAILFRRNVTSEVRVLSGWAAYAAAIFPRSGVLRRLKGARCLPL